jgi:hypothetical protein
MPDDQYNRALAQVHPPGRRSRGRAAATISWSSAAAPPRLVSAAGGAGLGAKVALVERSLLGGDCLNVGCVPSKALIAAARAAADAREAAVFGVHMSGVRVDFPAVMDQIVFYVDWVFHHPDLEALKKVYVEGGSGIAEVDIDIQQYLDSGWKDRGDPTAVSGVKVLSTVDANHVTVYAVFTVPPYDVVDTRTDAVVSHHVGRPAAGWSYELARDPADPNAHWLVVSRTDLGDLPG